MVRRTATRAPGPLRLLSSAASARRLVGERGEDEEQRIAGPVLGQVLLDFGRILAGPGACRPSGPPSRSVSVGLGVTTLPIRKTSMATPAKARPLADRLGSSRGRRTMSGSTSSRTRKKTPTPNSQR